MFNRSFDVSFVEQLKRFDGIVVLSMNREDQTNCKHGAGLQEETNCLSPLLLEQITPYLGRNARGFISLSKSLRSKIVHKSLFQFL